MLRKHQYEFSQAIDRIIFGEPIRNIYCHVTPGGGKSLVPVMAGRLITVGLADRLMWIAPRLSLTDQAEREFLNPRFRNLLNHRLTIRQSTNEPNPCRSQDGFSTTYNAVGMDEGYLLEQFRHYRYILIMDEFHHVQEDSLWHNKIAPLYAMAAYRILMTGTLERGDNSRIAFVPYRGTGKIATPFLQSDPRSVVIRYTRTDALAEKAIIPLAFHLSDGHAEWEDRSGRKVRVSSIDKMAEEDANKALYTVLKTEYADDLLSHGINHWQEHRRHFPNPKCLVVTSNINEAKRHIATLRERNFSADIATSDDSESALKAIKRMKAGKLDILVTVAMAYEGLDIPSVSHIICLTRIRSVPWIEQMTARANRIDPSAGPYEAQIGHIFAPADPLFKQVMDKIEKEQAPIVNISSRSWSRGETAEDGGGFRLEPSPGGITPLSSAMTGKRQMMLGAKEEPIKTVSEREDELLESINSHIRTYAFNNRYNPKKLNIEIFNYFGKPRQQMTVKELEDCYNHVKSVYPLSRIRGTGHKRVPTKATLFNLAGRIK
ncbi:MAG: helicase-related protein [Candidatus Marinimicrobia bacterium]|nr:helicase-related protein [Candidatus Neomarinimicrobiota bacterium]